MKILLIGSGGREHAIAWKLSKSERVSKIYVAPGNGGTAIEKKCENVGITDIEELLNFAKSRSIDLTVVGPEEPLINGIVNRFKEEGLKIFGPEKDGAMLEGSKSFSKDFMKKYGVATAEYKVFYEATKAKEYLNECKYPIVIKADGLAAGKGVVICETKEEAIENIDLFMVNDIFKGAGKKVVIEEFLKGVEASILSITDASNENDGDSFLFSFLNILGNVPSLAAANGSSESITVQISHELNIAIITPTFIIILPHLPITPIKTAAVDGGAIVDTSPCGKTPSGKSESAVYNNKQVKNPKNVALPTSF